MTRLTLNDDFKESMKKLCDGNPGAINVMFQCLDKDFISGSLTLVELDRKGIYGSDIWRIYKDECGEDIDKFMRKINPASFTEKGQQFSRRMQGELMKGDGKRETKH